MCLAAFAGHAPVVDLLLKRGAYPAIPYNQERPLLIVSMPKWTCLGRAVCQSAPQVRCRQRRQCIKKKRLSLVQSKQGHAQVVAQLLAAGVKKETTSKGETPLFKAVQIGNIEIVRLLLQANASTKLLVMA